MKYNRNRKQIQVSNSLWLLICEVRNTYIVIYMLHSVQSSRWQGGENFKKRGRKLNTLTPKCQIILKRHGNLLSISSEGGEHLHTPHKRYIKMSSFVVSACPRGVVEAFVRLLLHPSPQGHEYQPKGVAQDVAELQTCPCTKGAYNNSNGTDFKDIWTHFRVLTQCHDSYLLTFTFKEAHGDVERDTVGLHLMQKMQV